MTEVLFPMSATAHLQQQDVSVLPVLLARPQLDQGGGGQALEHVQQHCAGTETQAGAWHCLPSLLALAL